MLVPSSDVAVSTACDREDAPRRWSSSSWSKRRRPVQPPSDRENPLCTPSGYRIGLLVSHLNTR